MFSSQEQAHEREIMRRIEKIEQQIRDLNVAIAALQNGLLSARSN